MEPRYCVEAVRSFRSSYVRSAALIPIVLLMFCETGQALKDRMMEAQLALPAAMGPMSNPNIPVPMDAEIVGNHLKLLETATVFQWIQVTMACVGFLRVSERASSFRQSMTDPQAGPSSYP